MALDQQWDLQNYAESPLVGFQNLSPLLQLKLECSLQGKVAVEVLVEAARNLNNHRFQTKWSLQECLTNVMNESTEPSEN